MLPGHEIRTAYAMGWSTLKNGVLLAAAEASFELLITTDTNLRYQQRVTGRRLAILVVPQDLPELRHHAAEFLGAVNAMQPGEYRELSW